MSKQPTTQKPNNPKREDKAFPPLAAPIPTPPRMPQPPPQEKK